MGKTTIPQIKPPHGKQSSLSGLFKNIERGGWGRRGNPHPPPFPIGLFKITVGKGDFLSYIIVTRRIFPLHLPCPEPVEGMGREGGRRALLSLPKGRKGGDSSIAPPSSSPTYNKTDRKQTYTNLTKKSRKFLVPMAMGFPVGRGSAWNGNPVSPRCSKRLFEGRNKGWKEVVFRLIRLP